MPVLAIPVAEAALRTAVRAAEAKVAELITILQDMLPALIDEGVGSELNGKPDIKANLTPQDLVEIRRRLAPLRESVMASIEPTINAYPWPHRPDPAVPETGVHQWLTQAKGDVEQFCWKMQTVIMRPYGEVLSEYKFLQSPNWAVGLRYKSGIVIGHKLVHWRREYETALDKLFEADMNLRTAKEEAAFLARRRARGAP
jgi:hypothetical protein